MVAPCSRRSPPVGISAIKSKSLPVSPTLMRSFRTRPIPLSLDRRFKSHSQLQQREVENELTARSQTRDSNPECDFGKYLCCGCTPVQRLCSGPKVSTSVH